MVILCGKGLKMLSSVWERINNISGCPCGGIIFFFFEIALDVKQLTNNLVQKEIRIHRGKKERND